MCLRPPRWLWLSGGAAPACCFLRAGPGGQDPVSPRPAHTREQGNGGSGADAQGANQPHPAGTRETSRCTVCFLPVSLGCTGQACEHPREVGWS